MQAVNPGQAESEPGGVFGGEAFGEQVPVGIVVSQLGLDAGDIAG